MPDALFVPDGDRFVPTELCRGPWRPDAQHGGPPAALLARSVERAAGDDGMQTVRLTVELLRPVPLAPLAVVARIARPGRKVQLVEASLRTDDAEVARAVALRIRRHELPVPADADRRPLPPPGPDAGSASAPPWVLPDVPAFHSHAVEHRFVAGGLPIAPDADPSDGLLEVVLIPKLGAPEIALLAAEIVLGKHLSSNATVFRRAKKISVRSRPGMCFNVDGELVGNAPAVFQILPRALNFVVK